MCAITGVLNFDVQRTVDRDMLLCMRDSMKHRGPDDAGIYVDGSIGLASRRLSVIDLESGNQPIHNEDRTVWVVLNGEIYNFRSLRKNLEACGHAFYTHSDTEVVVHAYEEWGLDCLQSLKGMFAFALWDQRQQTLILARDRMGEKPLHYYVGPNELVFGSELKALFRHPAVPRDMDPNALSKYLTFQYVPAPHTIFRNVRKMLPGHFLTISQRGSRDDVQHQYWNIPKPVHHDSLPSVDVVGEKFVGLLRASVKSQLVSDVPVGILMSGGLDSTLVATFAAECRPGIQTFTMGFDEPTFDESRRAQLVAKRIGSDHHIEICRGKDMVDLAPEIIATLDEPLGDASILPTFLLARSTARSVKVALSGDGGDELFAGYPTFQALRYRRGVRMLPEFARRAMASAIRRLPISQEYLSMDFKLRQFMRGVEQPPERAFLYWMGAFTETDKQALLAHTGSDVFEDIAEASTFDDDVQKCLYLCAKHYLQDGVLVKMDRASMANSLEVRSPFLDQDVVEFAAECPLEYKMTISQTKWIVRHAARAILPGEVLWGKKRGFGAPVGKWIKGELKQLFCDTLDEERIRREGMFNPAEVHRLLAAHLAGTENNWRLLWTLLVFELWRERMQSEIQGRTPNF